MRIITGFVMAMAAALTVAAPAAAQSWQRVAGDAGQVGYIDADSLSGDAGHRLGNFYTVFADPIDGEVFASMVHAEFDCPGNYYRTLEYSYYGSGNAHLRTEPSTHPGEHLASEPHSLGAGFQRFACDGTGGVAVGADAWTDAQAFLASARAGGKK